jgi:hypothetical protein
MSVRRSARRVAGTVAALAALGALVMALLPAALAAAPTITLPVPGTYSTSQSFPGGTSLGSGSCGAVGLAGNYLFGGSMASGASLPNPYPTLHGSGSGGSGTTTDALKYVKLTLNGTYAVTGIVVVAYPNLFGSRIRYHYHTYTGVPAGAQVIDKLVPPTVPASSTTNGTYQAGSGSGAYTVLKRWFVCGTLAPATTAPAPATTPPATTPPATTPPVVTTAPTTPTTAAPTTPPAVVPPTSAAPTVPATSGAPATSAPPAIPAGPAGPLAGTGQSLTGLLWAGAGLLLGGLALLLFLGDRRSRRPGRPDDPAGT